MLPVDADIFRQLLESFPVGIYVVTLDRRIQFWNKAAERITGYLSQEVLGRSCGEDVMVHCASEGTPVCGTRGCLLACVLRDRQPSEAFLFARHKDGHRVPVHVTSIPLFDDAGKLHAVAEILQQQPGSSAFRLTGVGPEANDGLNLPSFAATQAYLQSRFVLPGQSAIFMIAIDGIREMARQRGLEMVHASVRALVHSLGELLPMPHFLGHWHDQSFLIVVPNATSEVFEDLLAQLRGLANSLTVIWWGDRIKPNARVRGAIIHDQESFQRMMLDQKPPAAEDEA